MVMKVIGRIEGIPNYTQWSELRVGSENCNDVPTNMPGGQLDDIVRRQAVRRAGRAKIANALAEKYGYTDTDPIGDDPGDFDKWMITNLSVAHRLADIIGLEKPLARVQVSNPGNAVLLHCDQLSFGYVNDTAIDEHGYSSYLTQEEKEAFNKDTNTVARIILFLEDWKHGQGFVWEDRVYDRWQAGDIIAWNWQTDSHATFNVGYWKRPILRLSGLVTDKFKTYLQQAEPFRYNY